MTIHQWVTYDMEKAQIRYVSFQEEDGIVKVTQTLFEQLLRDKGYEPEDEFNAKMEKLLKAVYK